MHPSWFLHYWSIKKSFSTSEIKKFTVALLRFNLKMSRQHSILPSFSYILKLRVRLPSSCARLQNSTNLTINRETKISRLWWVGVIGLRNARKSINGQICRITRWNSENSEMEFLYWEMEFVGDEESVVWTS